MAELQVRVSVVGHSHVRRLEQYILQAAGKGVNSHFGVKNATVNWFGRGGLKINQLFDQSTHDVIHQTTPDVLIIAIGDNDHLDSENCDPQLLALRMVSAASTFHWRYGVPKVGLICSYFPAIWLVREETNFMIAMQRRSTATWK